VNLVNWLAGVVVGAVMLPGALAGQGTLVTDSVRSPGLASNLVGDGPVRRVLVYLPPSYRRDTGRRYPVLYLLHGITSVPDEWLDGSYQGLDLRIALDSLAAAGAIPELIVVMPDANNKLEASWYANSPALGAWEDFVVRDLVRHVDRRYRTENGPARRALVGHSMGGFGVLAIGFNHPGVFGLVYSISPCCMGFIGRLAPSSPAWTALAALKRWQDATGPAALGLTLAAALDGSRTSPRLFDELPFSPGPDGSPVRNPAAEARWLARMPPDLASAMVRRGDRQPVIHIEAGSDEAGILAGIQLLRGRLDSLGIKYHDTTFVGGHIDRVRERFTHNVLPTVGTWLREAPGTGNEPAAPAKPAAPAGLDQYIEQSMKEWHIPGLALAVVKDGKVVIAKGYGIREMGRPEPVTANTLFAIGSATKSFTATVAGILVERGRLDLDARATKCLAGLELADPYLTREVTVRDLMTHRTGVAGGDVLWASGDFDRDEIVRRIRYVPAIRGLRSRFDYSNIMFIAAGQAIAAAGGADLDTLFRREILDPLGMTATTTSVRSFPRGGDIATPHDPRPEGPLPVAWRNMDNTLAGGGINSNAAEMARWLQFQLGKGQLDGRRLVSEEFIEATRTPETVIHRDGPWASMTPDAHFMPYGLGWFLSDYHGYQMLRHGGGIDGMSAMVGLMPELGVGIMVLTNLNGNLLPGALMHRVFDAYLGRPATDWSERARTMVTEAQAAEDAAMQQRLKGVVAGPAPTLPLAQYVGTYRHPAWGDLTITLDGGALVARYGTQLEGPLEHVQYDTFRAHWRNPARGTDYLNFTIDAMRQAAKADLYLWVTASFDRVR
jgi:CubicO group peptidase (beta-lactamase class C family)/enterochelin esterase-like enzyme